MENLELQCPWNTNSTVITYEYCIDIGEVYLILKAFADINHGLKRMKRNSTFLSMYYVSVLRKKMHKNYEKASGAKSNTYKQNCYLR